MGLILTAPFILASASPRRDELLRLLGLDFRVSPSGADESFFKGESSMAHVRRLSREKAGAVADGNPDSWVLGADTIVVIDGEVLGKPETTEEAGDMLRKLSGREHTVYTGFTIMKMNTSINEGSVVASAVVFRDIPEDEISWYIHSKEPYDKAGGYAVQGMGAFFIREIRGSYTNVMGLPLCEVVNVLKNVDAVRFVV